MCSRSLHSRQAAYCSQLCQWRSRKSTPVSVTCARPECLVQFEKLPGDPKKFCSRSCSAKVNNRIRSRQIKTHYGAYACVDCGKPRVNKTSSPRCSECHRSHRRDSTVTSWLNGSNPGGSGLSLSATIRQYLLEQANYGCSLCGFNTPHPVDGKTILEIDHINGDSSDHRPENLRVLCPNCHALTPTYRARNTGSGRPVYYLRVDKTHLE